MYTKYIQHDFFHDIIDEDLNINSDACYEDVDAKVCPHKWQPTTLVFSTVYDCMLCGEKKENT